MIYVWRVHSRLPERYMQLCRIVSRGKKNSCLVEFSDGEKVLTSRNYLMKLDTMLRRLALRSLKILDKQVLEILK